MTLAFFLSWQGVVLIIAKEGGTIAVTNELDRRHRQQEPVAGRWVGSCGRSSWSGIGVTAVLQGAPAPEVRPGRQPLQPRRDQGGVLAVIWGVGTLLLNKDRVARRRQAARGVPDAVPFILVIVVVLTLAARPHAAGAATSTPSAATPRPLGGPAST